MKVARRVLLLTAVSFPLMGAGALVAQEATGDSSESTQQPAPRVLYSAPAGDSIGVILPDAPVEVLLEEAEWVQVRLEGWMSRSAADGLRAPEVRNLSLSALRADPERYTGQPVRWHVQYVGLQQADALRSDMERGQPYLLVRDPGGEPGFVYALVPSQLMAKVDRLAPLQRVTIVGRVVVGRSALTGHPIIELTDILN